MSICTVPGCTRKMNARGLCGPHYAMWKKHGDPTYADKGLHLNSLGRPRNTPEDFWKHVEISSGCWMWIGGKDWDGYGIFSVGDVSVRATRYVLEVILQIDLTGLYACHTCDNPSCVNPEHLYAGTSKDNSHDRDSRGRGMRGRKQSSRHIANNVAARRDSRRSKPQRKQDA